MVMVVGPTEVGFGIVFFIQPIAVLQTGLCETNISELKMCNGILLDLGIMRHTRHNGPDGAN